MNKIQRNILPNAILVSHHFKVTSLERDGTLLFFFCKIMYDDSESFKMTRYEKIVIRDFSLNLNNNKKFICRGFRAIEKVYT